MAYGHPSLEMNNDQLSSSLLSIMILSNRPFRNSYSSSSNFY